MAWSEDDDIALSTYADAGDKMGGSSGALALDPIGTVASGKYSWGELAKGAFLGPVTKLFK